MKMHRFINIQQKTTESLLCPTSEFLSNKYTHYKIRLVPIYLTLIFCVPCSILLSFYVSKNIHQRNYDGFLLDVFGRHLVQSFARSGT
jgi:hypothetical protein